MEQIVTAIATLINTGSALAGDALYIYFALKAVSTLTIPLSLYTVLVGVRKIVAMIMRYSGRSQYYSTARSVADAHNRYRNDDGNPELLETQLKRLSDDFNKEVK